MASIIPVTFNSGSTIPGTLQVGDLAIGTTPQDYTLQPGGKQWWATPDLDLAYAVAHPNYNSNQPNPLSVPNVSVGFWKSQLKTEESFIELAQYISITDNDPQTFTGGTEAKDWLNNNGYWTSYVDIWGYNSGVDLSWPSSSSGYTLYNGGFNSIDDGFSNVAIQSLDMFEMNNQGPTKNIYVSTNGYITLGQGSGGIISTPQQQINPAGICANPGDNWLQPGLANNDGDVQNVYYMTGGTQGKSYIKFLVYGGTYGATTTPTSWILNFYIDAQYQWVETRVKSNTRGNAGPYNIVDVSQQSSTTSRVWRGDLNGQNWEYLGTGSIQ